jgi:hypothetical protein
MTKKMIGLSVAALLLSGFVSFGMAAEKGTWTGWIADENCAKNYEKAATAEHKGCAESCVSRGAKWALSTKDGAFILDMEGAKAAENLGHEVMVDGELDKDTNTIKVTAVINLRTPRSHQVSGGVRPRRS